MRTGLRSFRSEMSYGYDTGKSYLDPSMELEGMYIGARGIHGDREKAIVIT